MLGARGFTLTEILLSVALIALIGGVSILIAQTLQNRSDLDSAAGQFAAGARRASALAQSSDGDSAWGVRAATGSVTVFRGPSFAARVAEFDETADISAGVSVSGASEYVFSKLTGYPAAAGTTTLTGQGGQVRTVIINARGAVIY